jgi:dephospho-CoA kinase
MRGQRKNKPLIIGLTGSFGSGKSTLAEIFRSYGAEVLDADKIAHKLIQPGMRVYRRLIKAFGKEILKQNKQIDRQHLAELAFSRKKLLAKLNRLTHPEIIKVIKKKLKASGAKVVVLDAPLLIEAGLRDMVDKLIVVGIDRAKQLERLLRKTSLSRKDILTRLNSQLPLAKKITLADFVIDNSGTVSQTKKQTAEIWRKLWRN